MILFGGTDEDVSVPDSASLSITGDFTMGCWVNFANLPSNDDMRFFTKFEPTGDERSYTLFVRDTAGTKTIHLTISSDGANGAAVNVGITLSANTDTHLIWQYDASAGQLEAFKNGASLGTAGGLFASIFDSTAVLNLGSDRGSSDFHDGTATEFFIYDTILTSTEIQALANSYVKHMPLQIQPSSLQGYWPMDDQPDGTSADTDTVRDLSGNGNDGTGDDRTGGVLTWQAENFLSYPVSATYVPFQTTPPVPGAVNGLIGGGLPGPSLVG